MKALILLLAVMASSVTFGQDEKPAQQWVAEANANAEKAFGAYYAICNDRVVVKDSYGNNHEFNGKNAKARVMGTYALATADTLNGKLWSGKILVDMGDSARSYRTDGEGNKTISAWGSGREAEFDFMFADNRWQIVGAIFSYVNGNIELRSGVSCPAAG